MAIGRHLGELKQKKIHLTSSPKECECKGTYLQKGLPKGNPPPDFKLKSGWMDGEKK